MKTAPRSSLEALLDVANTVHGPDAHEWPSRQSDTARHDHLVNPGQARAFFREQDLDVPRAPLRDHLASLRQLREATWAVMAANAPQKSKQAVSALLRTATYRLDAGGGLRPTAGGWPGFVASLLPALIDLQGQGKRPKVCQNRRCGWLFIDESKNGSRVWCDMATCGNRAKVTRFMRRQASPRPRRGSAHGSHR